MLLYKFVYIKKNDIKKIRGDHLTSVNFNFDRGGKPLLTFVWLNLYAASIFRKLFKFPVTTTVYNKKQQWIETFKRQVF